VGACLSGILPKPLRGIEAMRIRGAGGGEAGLGQKPG
jgi:hypothetical protein